MHSKFRISAAIFSVLLFMTPLAGADAASQNVSMIFGSKASKKPISVYRHNPDTGKNRLVKTCKKTCEIDLEAADRFFILFPAKNKKYKTYIRRNQEDAELKDGVYYFDLTYGAPEDEERNYFRAYAEDQTSEAQDELCDNFDVSKLSDRPKACFKVKPSLPPRTRRSGWCKVAMTILINGRNKDVSARSCSEDIFKISSEEAVKLYRYYPKLKDGQAVSSRLITTVNFTLSDEKGKIIPPKNEK